MPYQEKNRDQRNNPRIKEEREYEQQLVDLARVTRVVKGGKRLSFRACIVLGNFKGEVGVGVAKGADVSIAIEKAVRKANKNLVKVLIRPAEKGHGLVAGGVVRTVLSLAGLKNATAKIMGSKNKINNVQATIKALESLSSQ